jgi:hypothetical protein
MGSFLNPRAPAGAKMQGTSELFDTEHPHLGRFAHAPARVAGGEAARAFEKPDGTGR